MNAFRLKKIRQIVQIFVAFSEKLNFSTSIFILLLQLLVKSNPKKGLFKKLLKVYLHRKNDVPYYSLICAQLRPSIGWWPKWPPIAPFFPVWSMHSMQDFDYWPFFSQIQCFWTMCGFGSFYRLASKTAISETANFKKAISKTANIEKGANPQ